MELWDTRGVGKESQKVAIVEEDGRRWLASKEDKEKEKGVSKRSKGDEMRGNKENKHGDKTIGRIGDQGEKEILFLDQNFCFELKNQFGL